MNALDGIIEDLNVTTFDIINDALKPFVEQEKRSEIFFERIREVINEYKKSGIVADPSNWESWFDGAEVQFPANENRSSTKENIEPKKIKKEKEPPSSPPPTRPRRNAFKEASQSINQQSSMSLNAKLRRPKELEDNFQNVYIKKEKLTMTTEELVRNTTDTTDAPAEEVVQVKKEVEEMPAPSRPAPRKKKRKGTERKIKQEKLDEEEEEKRKNAQVRDSDIIVQDATVTIVNLDSSDDGDKTIKEQISKKKTKRSRTSSSEDESKASAEKRSKPTHENNDDQTDHEDVQSTVNDANNATFISSKPAENNIMNATVVVDNPKCVNLPNLIPQSVNDLMTDDESEEEVKVKNVPKPKGAIPRPRKPIFSPFEQSPVKKKVQAFEKLQEDSSAIPPRTTRTKTRALAKKQQEQEESSTAKDATSSDVDSHPTNTNVKEKAKIFTPLGTKFLPSVSSTALQTNRVIPSRSNDKSLLSAKTASALKASQAEYREREKKRREKEQEALKKREALIQSQIEEKKRKREEKQLKAQQQREALEKEKLKALDAQRLKDERHKQLLAEQEEKKLKHKEEQEKKRQMAKIRAIEEKRREEEKRQEEQKRMEEMTAQMAKRDKDIAQMVQKQKEHKKVPIYMQIRAPLLPTPDCYDSDDDRRPETVSFPSWCTESNMKITLRCASACGERLKNTFFSIQAQTPDLQDIFETIEAKKLKRTSSAVWDKPPRFTMLPVLENHDETEEFDEGFDYD